MASSVETIPMDVRVGWLREVHAEPHVAITAIADDLAVDYGSDAAWRGHVALMREAVAAVTDEAVDAVFTSETYGDELGRRLGARHVAVDPERALVPASATAVRADLAAAWEHLAPCVRGGLARRVILVGAESTGKTTLAQALTDRLRQRGGAHGATRWIGEYGRDATVDKLAIARARAALAGRPPPSMDDLVWVSADFVAIAREQQRREDEAARAGGPVLIGDTDAFATAVWHERYLGRRDVAVEALSTPSPRVLYLLTDPDDVPFVQDGLRDGERIRRWMTDTFAQRLDERGRRWRWLRGDREARLDAALRAIDDELVRGAELAPPLPPTR